MAGGTVVVATVPVFGASATDKTAPILAFVGAVLVALITAYTAPRRQVLALEAESKRLAQQLQHDRELADLADVRSALSDAALTLHRVGMLPLARAVQPDDLERIGTGQPELSAHATRLVVLLGMGHRATKTLRDARHGWVIG